MLLNEVIVKEKDGYVIYSHDKSKKLSKPYADKEQAVKRLRQIEYFKHLKGGNNASKKFGKNVSVFDLVDELKGKKK